MGAREGGRCREFWKRTRTHRVACFVQVQPVGEERREPRRIVPRRRPHRAPHVDDGDAPRRADLPDRVRVRLRHGEQAVQLQRRVARREVRRALRDEVLENLLILVVGVLVGAVQDATMEF